MSSTTTFGVLSWSCTLILFAIISPNEMFIFFQYFVVFYCFVSLLFILYFIRSNRINPPKSIERPIYNIPKKSKGLDELTWKQRLVGTWDLLEREGFVEFVVFMGIVSAGMAKLLSKKIESQPLQNVLAFKDDSEKEMKVDAIGKPEIYGHWITIGIDEATAIPVPFIQDKEEGFEKMWWDEVNQSLCRVRESPKKGVKALQVRSTIEDGMKMVFTNTTTKSDGTTNVFKVIFKRVET